MLRQLLDQGLPKEAVSYLILVSDCLREIEKVITVILIPLHHKESKSII